MLDQLSPEDRAEVEQLAQKHPEIQEEIRATELALEEYALQQAIAPSPDVFQRIQEAIEPTSPASTTSPPNAPASKPESHTSSNRLPLILAIIALLVALAFGIWQRVQLGNANAEVARLQQQTAALQATLANCDTLERQLALLQSPDVQVLSLQGQPNTPDASAFVFYTPNGNRTVISAADLPALPPGQQYQLWALLPVGDPESLGVLPLDARPADLLEFDLKNLQPVGFAISREPEGGSDTPTTIFVAGTVS